MTYKHMQWFTHAPPKGGSVGGFLTELPRTLCHLIPHNQCIIIHNPTHMWGYLMTGLLCLRYISKMYRLYTGFWIKCLLILYLIWTYPFDNLNSVIINKCILIIIIKNNFVIFFVFFQNQMIDIRFVSPLSLQ